MPAIRVLIVDDEAPARAKLRHFLKDEPDFRLVGEAQNGDEALTSLKAQKPDLIFLDIQIPGVNGLEVAQTVKNNSPHTQIIFVTAYDEHALKAFDLAAVDYLLKPYSRDRFKQALERTRQRLAASKSTSNDSRKRPHQLRFNTAEGIRLISSSDLEWAEASANYIKICTHNDALIVRSTLANLEAMLDPAIFCRVHRSHIVNITKVTRVESATKGDYRLYLGDSVVLRLSRHYKDNFFTQFNHLHDR